MARKLKTYLTSLGFYEQAIASPSIKAALKHGVPTATCFTKVPPRKAPIRTSSPRP
jgi:hypothetical protein